MSSTDGYRTTRSVPISIQILQERTPSKGSAVYTHTPVSPEDWEAKPFDTMNCTLVTQSRRRAPLTIDLTSNVRSAVLNSDSKFVWSLTKDYGNNQVPILQTDRLQCTAHEALRELHQKSLNDPSKNWGMRFTLIQQAQGDWRESEDYSSLFQCGIHLYVLDFSRPSTAASSELKSALGSDIAQVGEEAPSVSRPPLVVPYPMQQQVDRANRCTMTSSGPLKTRGRIPVFFVPPGRELQESGLNSASFFLTRKRPKHGAKSKQRILPKSGLKAHVYSWTHFICLLGSKGKATEELACNADYALHELQKRSQANPDARYGLGLRLEKMDPTSLDSENHQFTSPAISRTFKIALRLCVEEQPSRQHDTLLRAPTTLGLRAAIGSSLARATEEAPPLPRGPFVVPYVKKK